MVIGSCMFCVTESIALGQCISDDDILSDSDLSVSVTDTRQETD